MQKNMAVKNKDKTAAAGGTAAKRSGKDNARWVIGWTIMIIGIFATLSVLSYFVHWKHDYSVIHPGILDDADKVENLCGYAGAYISNAIINRAFGLFGVLVPILAIMLGVRIIRRRSMFFNHSTLCCVLILILGSMTLGLAFGSNWGVFNSGWGGAFGVFTIAKIRGLLGPIGAILTLVFGWVLTGVFININFINTVNSAGTAVADKGEAAWDGVRNMFSGVFKKSSKGFEDNYDITEPAEDAEAVPESVPPQVEEPEVVVPQPYAGPLEEDFEIKTEVERQTVETEVTDDVTPHFDEVEAADIEISENDDMNIEAEPEQMTDAAAEEPEEPEEVVPVRKKGMFEEFVEDDDNDASEAQQTIIVQEHHEKQVGEHEIGSLYDPTKDIHNYRRPSVELLVDHSSNSRVSDEEITSNKLRIEETLKSFGIPIRDMKATVGPTVTLYEIVQEQGVQISKIRKLDNDIAQSLKALGIRIIAPIPGRGTIGIEVPNQDKETVSMRSAILSKRFQQFDGELPVVIGRTIQNENYVFDLAKMPHLLVAGATGQGKSVGLNAIITSLLYRKHPSQLKFVMIDPKMVEFSLYARLEKHFLAKMESEDEVIITDPKKAVNTLQSLCIEMGNRLELCKKAAAKNIVEYNEKFLNRRLNPQNGHYYMPYIVVVIDEFADLIMMAKEVEAPVMRLAQKARAIGIHLIIATQRPDVKVITGGIKANFPSRIAFRVMSMTDSRTIIDQPGANQLIGRGDMLFSKNGELTRIQCAFIDTPEVENIVEAIASQPGYSYAYPLPDYEEAAGTGSESVGSDLGGGTAIKYDSLFAEIAREAVSGGQISTSYIQRNFEVGFNRAGRIMTQLERAGIVGPQIGAKPREIKFYDLPSLEAKLQDLGLS